MFILDIINWKFSLDEVNIIQDPGIEHLLPLLEFLSGQKCTLSQEPWTD
jgi:hypothetical protein